MEWRWSGWILLLNRSVKLNTCGFAQKPALNGLCHGMEKQIFYKIVIKYFSNA